MRHDVPNRRHRCRHLAATALIVGLAASSSCSSDSSEDPSVAADGSRSGGTAVEALAAQWGAMSADERLLRCRIFTGQMPDGPSPDEQHADLVGQNPALADLSFDEWNEFMGTSCS